jgi:hypothetical protein
VIVHVGIFDVIAFAAVFGKITPSQSRRNFLGLVVKTHGDHAQVEKSFWLSADWFVVVEFDEMSGQNRR